MLSTKREIQILANPEELSHRAAEEFVRRAEETVQAKGLFTVALSGGSTPRRLYSLLGSETGSFRVRLPWGEIHFFGAMSGTFHRTSRASNYRMVSEA